MPAKAKGGFIDPMLLLRTDSLPNDGDRWEYQLKFDGYRAIAFKTAGKLFLRSRNDNDFSRLNEHWFVSLADAKAIIEAWRVDYNTVRPHGSLGQLTPAAYAAASADPKPGCGVCSAAALATTDRRPNPDGLSVSV